MRITEIETHEICPPFHAWNTEALTRYQGADFRYRTVHVVHTDNGLVGLGEHTGKKWPAEDEWIERMKGTNPCEWLAHPELPIGLAPAVYDLVAQYNEVPVYRLFGPRSGSGYSAGSPAMTARVPMSAWTVSQTPSKMAEEVLHAMEAGHTWLKYHTNHFHDVVAQTDAMQKVAPPGFKIHYDLNFDSTVEHILNLARELQVYPIAGALEDPVRNEDFEGYKQLRQRSSIPIYFHHLLMQGREAILGLADGYMLGHAPVGQVIRRAGLFEAANAPFMLQNTGGNIMRAFITHMAGVFPMATLHHVVGTDLWAEDVVTPTLEVKGGTVAVPEGPGLGVTLDRDALERWSAVRPDPYPRALVRVQYRGMPAIYSRLPVKSLKDREGSDPSIMGAYGGGYNQPVDLDYWDDDGSTEFSTMWERTAAGTVS
jgi:L-alanine-DL-glutamate epimerase-like enolase superfamily enzyme